MADLQHMLDILNYFLRLERTAKIQYEQHLTIVEHEPAQTILADIINEENQHIQWLTTAIEDFGGKPTAHTDEIATPEDFEHMMRANYDMESIIIEEYEHHLNEIWDPQLRQLVSVILEQAKQHKEQFRGLFEDFGTDEFMTQAI